MIWISSRPAKIKMLKREFLRHFSSISSNSISELSITVGSKRNATRYVYLDLNRFSHQFKEGFNSAVGFGYSQSNQIKSDLITT